MRNVVIWYLEFKSNISTIVVLCSSLVKINNSYIKFNFAADLGAKYFKLAIREKGNCNTDLEGEPAQLHDINKLFFYF